MSIDRGDSHFGDAGSWEKACRHMALFLCWSFERGLGSSDEIEIEIDLAEVAKAPRASSSASASPRAAGR